MYYLYFVDFIIIKEPISEHAIISVLTEGIDEDNV